jgi:carboxymethylenebutenolidase
MCRLVPVAGRDNGCGVDAQAMPTDLPVDSLPEPVRGEWVRIAPLTAGQVPLRCWWERPGPGPARAGVLVLPEVFGINGWVRSVAARLAARGYAALAVPLFARTAPDLELGYDPEALAEGRSHKERTTTPQLLADLALASAWLERTLEGAGEAGKCVGERRGRLGCVGFCFGGHVALLAATLPEVAATCDFYGAGVASGRPGGGPPSLELLPQIQGRLLCVVGSEDPLLPPADVETIGQALEAANALRSAHALPPHCLITVAAGHGFMCEARADFRPEPAAVGWREMLELFEREL